MASKIVRVGVVGAGVMGAGIAQTFAAHGFEVVLLDERQEALDGAFDRMQRSIRKLAGKGREPWSGGEGLLGRVRGVLEAAGSGLDRVVKTTVFLSDMDDFPVYNTAYAELLPEPRPARSTIGAHLPDGILVEIEAIAYVKK